MPLRLVGHPAPDFKLVGTRSCAIRHRTSEKGEHLVKPMGKSLSSDSARARSQKQQKKTRRDVQRRTRGSASLPAPAELLGPIISTVHTNDSIRNKGLLVSALLELFLDSSARVQAKV